MINISKIWGLLWQSAIYCISFFVPKNKKVWIFGSWTGNTFSDNPKYLYLHIRKYHPEIRCVYICKDNHIVEKLNKDGMEAYGYYSIKGCLLSMRAKVAFLTAAHCDVNSFCCARISYIQLFHGTPIKKIYEDDRVNGVIEIPKWKKFLIQNVLKFLGSVEKNDYVTIASPNVAASFESAFQINDNRLLVTGLARTDAYINPPPNKYIMDLKKKLKDPLIVYLPTHRNYGNHKEGYVDMLNDFDYVNSLLEENHIYMLYKPHFNELKNLNSINSKYSHIIIPDDEECTSDVYAFTPYCDLLITDYSSIYFDYLLASKPIVFFVYDIQNYTSTEREFYYNFNEVTPGPKCINWDDTISEVKHLLKQDDTFVQRSIICNFFNEYNDGNSCERIFQEIYSMIISKGDEG